MFTYSMSAPTPSRVVAKPTARAPKSNVSTRVARMIRASSTPGFNRRISIAPTVASAFSSESMLESAAARMPASNSPTRPHRGSRCFMNHGTT
ncbi:MAG: hypothetical protein CMJ18_23160 [Phycisphaeraceae bacterium]|nr:hypothetical protein [Phycisphaeraceae bacterium]